MGTINLGDQTITYSFQYPGGAQEFNKINFALLPRGIYSGGTLEKVSSSVVNINPFICYFSDSLNELGVRVQTLESKGISVSESEPYIVIQFSWENSLNQGLIKTKEYADIDDDDIIIGRCEYVNNVLQDSFDYTRSHRPYISGIKESSKELNVLSTEPFSNKVLIKGGSLTTMNREITISETLSPAISNTTLGRIDLVYMDDDGSIKIDEGVDSSTPVPNSYLGKYVLAEVHRGASSSYITQNDIVNVSNENFDFSSISQSAEYEKGADLVHVGSQEGLNNYEYAQDELGRIARKTYQFIDLEFAENVLKDEPIGLNSSGKAVKSGIRFEHELNTGIPSSVNVIDYCITKNGESFIIAWYDLTAIGNIFIMGGRYDEINDEYKTTSIETVSSPIINDDCQLALSNYRDDHFILFWCQNTSDGGHVRIGKYNTSIDSDDELSWVTSDTTVVSSVTLYEPAVASFGTEDRFVLTYCDNDTEWTTSWYNGIWYRIGYEDSGSITWDISSTLHAFSSRGTNERYYQDWNQRPQLYNFGSETENIFCTISSGARTDGDAGWAIQGEFDSGDASADFSFYNDSSGTDGVTRLSNSSRTVFAYTENLGKLSGSLVYLEEATTGLHGTTLENLYMLEFNFNDFSYNYLGGRGWSLPAGIPLGEVRGFSRNYRSNKQYISGVDDGAYDVITENYFPDEIENNGLDSGSIFQLQAIKPNSELSMCFSYKDFSILFYNEDLGSGDESKLVFYISIPFKGIANEDVTSGNTGEVCIKGKYEGNFTNLKAGSFYYLNPITKEIRNIGQTAIGFAVDTNSLVIL